MKHISYLELKEGVDCSYEIGIWSELNSFMEYNSDKIAKYKNNYLKSEEKYLVEINLKNYCKEDALGLFHKIAVFLEYNYLTIYTKQFFEEKIVFNLFSKSLSSLGFHVEITIL